MAINTNDTTRMITGVFRDNEMANRAFDVVKSRGYKDDEINVLMTESTQKKHYKDTPSRGKTEIQKGNKAAEGAGVGGGVGAGLGALIVGVLAAGAAPLAVPGLVIAGPLAGALTGAGAGGVTGGIIGMLIGAGIPEERAKIYETHLESGGIVLGVVPHDVADADYIRREWEALGGKDVYDETLMPERAGAHA